MDFKRFNILVLGTLATVIALCVGSSYCINIYGLYGNVTGRELTVLGTERTAKYLLSFNYIPSNFNGLLVGSSITDNWDTSAIHTGRIYNASLSGGNISEEALIVENAFRRRPFKTALFVIFPYMTATYGRKSGNMAPNEYWAGLGSVQLIEAYVSWWAQHNGLAQQTSTPFGQNRFAELKLGHAEVLEKLAKEEAVTFDERAVAQYRELLGKARINGASVVGIVPLVSKDFEAAKGKSYREYLQMMGKLFGPGEPILDLNACPELAALRQDEAAFPDGVHLAPWAADRCVETIDRWLRAQAGK